MIIHYEMLFEAALTPIDPSFRACCVFDEKRAVPERNPFAMITHYEKLFEECDQGNGVPLKSPQHFIVISQCAE